jgi:predicted DNA-binding transcriptional regulator AlpA
MDQSAVIYVPELAKLLGLTEAAVRGHYYRRSGAIPKGFKMGAKLAWRRESVEAFIAQKEREAR